MTNKRQTGFLVLVFAAGLAGCEGASPSTPTAPSSAPLQPTARPTPSVPAFVDVTLSGLVFELTTTGQVPIEGVKVYCEPCGAETHTWAYTDSNGLYKFTGVWVDGLPTRVWIGKDGYADPAGLPTPTPPNPTGGGWREVTINGDTRFDVQLVKR